MNFLELTSYIDAQQGYTEFPDFKSGVWPLVTRKGNKIESVFTFRVGWAGYHEVISPRIVRLRSMGELTDRELETIQPLIFYGGHLNVLYQTSIESSVLRELCKLYPIVNMSSDDVEPLGIEPEALAELKAFTAALQQESLCFSFAHDADPLYVFGHLETLRALLRTHSAPEPLP